MLVRRVMCTMFDGYLRETMFNALRGSSMVMLLQFATGDELAALLPSIIDKAF